MKVAVIGGTGKLGFPVAAGLQAAGMEVSIVTRNVLQAEHKIGRLFNYIECDVNDPSNLTQKLAGFDAVHINLSGINELQCKLTIAQGTENIVQACKANNITLISFISGTTVNEHNTDFYDTKSKYQAEQSIIACGIPYLIFCPSWFMESLPQFVQEKRASVFGPASQPIHWVAVCDYVQQVVNAYQDINVRNKRLYVHGPQAISLKGALAQYLNAMQTPLTVTHTPHWMAGILEWLTGDNSIKYASDLCKYFEDVGESGDPAPSNALVGSPSTQLSQWCQQRFNQEKLVQAV